MNMSFWSHCQGLVRRLQQRRSMARPRERQQPWSMTESLEARMLLSSTPAMVADIVPGLGSSNPQNLVAIGSTTYFTAYDNIHGQELWKSDGTVAGTMMVKEIAPGANPGGTSSRIGNLAAVNGTLYFTADDGVHGMELWKSDGTVAGTMMVADINAGGGSSYAGRAMNGNGTLYFTANDGVHGFELWKSDGTAAGTTMVKDILPGGFTDPYGQYLVNSASPSNLTYVNGTLFFTANIGNGIHSKLWKSDGTVAGTVAVSSSVFYRANQFTNVNGTLFFTAEEAGKDDGYELWKSDGTAAGTTIVKDIYPGETTYYRYYGYTGRWVTVPNSSNPGSLSSVNGNLYFTANDGAHGRELWKSDGTATGTVMVTDPPGSVSSGPTNVNGTLYFSRDASSDPRAYELWKSDGTSAGTAVVALIPGAASGFFGPPRYSTNVNGTLYFVAFDNDHGPELWKSDGTESGTTMVADILPGGYAGYYGSYFPRYLTNANGTLFFTTYDGVHGNELWALDTTAPPVSTTSLSVNGLPATTTAGAGVSFTITAKNADGTTNTGYVGKVHFTSSDPQAVLPADYIFTAADQGTHTFTATLKTAGSQSLTATDTQTPGVAGANASMLVKAGAVSGMIVSGFPSSTTAGALGQVTVTITDVYGNAADSYGGTVHFTSSDPKAVLPADYKFTAADAGQHTFSVTLKTAGPQSITVAGAIRVTLTGTQSGITVNAGAASQFAISGAPTSVRASATFSLKLTVTDAYGNVVTGYTGTVRFTSTDSFARLPANYTFTTADKGVHTFTGLVLRKRGNQKITITDLLNSSLNASVTLSVR